MTKFTWPWVNPGLHLPGLRGDWREVTKKLSKEFNKTESRILGALSKLDEFLLNPQVRTCSVIQGASRNASSKNREILGDRFPNDLYPEWGYFPDHSRQLNSPQANLVTEPYSHRIQLQTFPSKSNTRKLQSKTWNAAEKKLIPIREATIPINKMKQKRSCNQFPSFMSDSYLSTGSMTCMHLKKFKVFSSLRRPQTHCRHAQGHPGAGASTGSIGIF